MCRQGRCESSFGNIEASPLDLTRNPWTLEELLQQPFVQRLHQGLACLNFPPGSKHPALTHVGKESLHVAQCLSHSNVAQCGHPQHRHLPPMCTRLQKPGGSGVLRDRAAGGLLEISISFVDKNQIREFHHTAFNTLKLISRPGDQQQYKKISH